MPLGDPAAPLHHELHRAHPIVTPDCPVERSFNSVELRYEDEKKVPDDLSARVRRRVTCSLGSSLSPLRNSSSIEYGPECASKSHHSDHETSDAERI
jgi:hypothetical protein